MPAGTHAYELLH